MLYYIGMTETNPFKNDKYKIMDNNREPKPIDEVLQTLESIVIDIKGIKTEVSHIKGYIRKETIKKMKEEEEIANVDKDYVKPNQGWFGW
jgi:hypothetical protein